jgi:hypothetical protein
MYCLTIINGDFPPINTYFNISTLYKSWTKKRPDEAYLIKHRKFLKPAWEHINGNFEYFCDGLPYRILKKENHTEIVVLCLGDRETPHSIEGNPSVIYNNGTKEWHFYGSLNRDDFPAIEYANGDKKYWALGRRHRENGPAVIYGEKQYWYIHGEFIKCIV